MIMPITPDKPLVYQGFSLFFLWINLWIVWKTPCHRYSLLSIS